MKQVLQSLKTGAIEVAEVPCPSAGPGRLLIRTRYSVVSAGTERMLIEFGKASLIEKARQQPDKVRLVLEKVRTDGVAAAVDAVARKLDQPLAPGYCNVGEVVELGAGVGGFEVGQTVVSNGRHAEYVCVPVNLCAAVPDGVKAEDAAFTILGAIALQGIRLVAPSLSECVVVTGLGLIGLMTVQLLRAHGCRVLALDIDPSRVHLARAFGAEALALEAGNAVPEAMRFSRGRGVDAVIITASTRSNDPVHQAALMCRKRGRIVLVGATGLELSRTDFYEKELSFQVSCSYGPGRYDAEYEEKGHDYPVGFVRWTEQRNLEAVLDMMAAGRLDVSRLVTHRFPIARAEEAYRLITSEQPSLGVVFEYPCGTPVKDAPSSSVRVGAARSASGMPAIGFLGAGDYAASTLIPAFRASGARLKTISSANGVSGTVAARKHGFEVSTTDNAAILNDSEIGAVVIATRHSSHAHWICEALAAGKHVFVEKPMAMTLAQVDAIALAAANAPSRILFVGFNRRFAPHVRTMARLLGGVPGPKSFIMTVNAGAIPMTHWTQDVDAGGGRIIGEACHFIDLLRHLAASPIEDVSVHAMDCTATAVPDTCTLSLKFENGSIGAIHYFANGHKSVPKERLEVFAAGRVMRLDNFRRLEASGWREFSSERLWRQDKGQAAAVKAFLEALADGGASPIALDELLEVARTTIRAGELARGA